jgi:hypothetical protein
MPATSGQVEYPVGALARLPDYATFARIVMGLRWCTVARDYRAQVLQPNGVHTSTASIASQNSGSPRV